MSIDSMPFLLQFQKDALKEQLESDVEAVDRVPDSCEDCPRCKDETCKKETTDEGDLWDFLDQVFRRLLGTSVDAALSPNERHEVTQIIEAM